MIKLILILSIIKIGLATTATSQKYSSQIDTSIVSTDSSNGLIKVYKFKSKFDCLAQCNLNSNCYTVTYSSDTSLIHNCALYSKYFNQGELVSLKNTNLYSKPTSEYKIGFYSF